MAVVYPGLVKEWLGRDASRLDVTRLCSYISADGDHVRSCERDITLLKRGLDFSDAVTVFAGPSFTVEDDRADYPERRFQTYGLLEGRLVILVWTGTDARRRIISMRKCNAREQPDLDKDWVDPDDAPEWTDEQWDRAEIAIGGKVIRPATGTLTKPGRPPLGERAKRQVTLRLDPDVLDRFRADGPGWQSRVNAALRKAVGL